jgi:hypothetical protein
MAVWDLIGRQLPPGEVTPDLSFQALGLPGISTFWAGGKFKRSSDEDAAETEVDDPLTNEMVSGVTVGVEPLPADRTSPALLQRLRSLTSLSCKAPTLWITDASLCSELVSDLARAEALSSSGQVTQAKEVVSHYINRLADPRATGVTSPAYWLLKSNAEIINGKL